MTTTEPGSEHAAKLQKLRNELAEEKKGRDASIAAATESLKHRSLVELMQLREYWESERKKNKKLDDTSTANRQNAENHIAVIDSLVRAPVPAHHKKDPKAEQTNPDNMSVAEAALYLNLSESTLYKMTSTKKIPHYKMGKSIQFSKEDLESYRQSKRSKGSDEINKQAEAEADRLEFKRRRKA